MTAMRIFDRAALAAHKDRAAARLDEHDFLFREVADRLADRLLDVKREFGDTLILGAHGGCMAAALAEGGLTPRVGRVIQTDLAPALAAKAGALAVDEECLPFEEGRFDLVLSLLDLHWVNDLPGALVQIRRILKPDGLFLGALFGAGTLHELRDAWMRAEMELEGGVSPRVSPFAELRDLGALLQRAGLALPVADGERLTVSFSDPFALMRDLRGMGETNAVIERRKSLTRRETVMRMAQIYMDTHADEEGRIPATFELVYLTGWAPHESQQKALRPGSAAASLAEALGAPETPLKDS